MMHPTTDAVLTAQRDILAKLMPAETPLAEQVQISRELLWHAMFTLCATAHQDMQDIAEMSRDAITAGIKFRKGTRT